LGAYASYDKLQRVAGDFAIVSVALVATVEDGILTYLRLAVGGCGPKPARQPDAETMLIGKTWDAKRANAAAQLIAETCDPVDDVRASAAYRRTVAPRMIVRALARAFGRESRAA
jgi:CO/xanthine dehydrogenase FAD-binding subunit